MKKIFTCVFILFVFISARGQVGTTVVISQVYGGGGNSGASFQNDYVELFNPTPAAQSLNGWSIQYASATGTSWQVTKLTDFSLQPGQYYLIKLASGGAVGTALPAEDASGGSNMSATSGKVVLSNDTLPVNSCLPNAAIVDFVGFGSANCFEGAAAAPGSGGNTNSIFRATNGCQDGNNNSADFAAAATNPRNSSSPLSTCGAATALISASPGSLNFTTTFGVASSVISYNLSGSTLSPAAGNITVTPGTNVEISLSSGGPFITGPASLTVPYTGSTLGATAVFVRITATAPQGVFTGIVTNSGGSAPDVIVNINGGVFQNYFNTKANTGLNNAGTWSTTTDGSGPSPANFTDPYQLFNIISQANATYSGTWAVTAAGNTARVVVGDGIAPINFTILPDADSVTSATRIDILNNAILTVQNNRRPFFNNIAIGSTIDFAQAGTGTTDTIRFPTLSYYHLKLTNGIKYFSNGTTTVRGNLTVDGVVGINGSNTTVSKLNIFGNINFTASQSQFEPSPSGDAGRITIGMNGGSGSQSINANGNELNIFRLQRDTTTSANVITLGANTTLTLGNANGGGLQLNQSGVNATTLVVGSNVINLTNGAFVTTSSTGRISSTAGQIIITKSAGNQTAGLLRFTPGSVLNNLTLNFGAAFSRDSITLNDSVSVQNLLLTKGKLVVNSNAVLVLPDGAITNAGSIASFVDGKMKATSSVQMGFPVGKGNKYAPVGLAVNGGVQNSYTVQYFNVPFTNFTIDPVTLAAFPNYNVSRFEYWTIDQATPGSANVTFSYSDPGSFISDTTGLSVAHYDGTDWDDIGGAVFSTSTPALGAITAINVTQFSPFTLAARQLGIIPVKLEYIRGQRQNNVNALNWKVTCIGNRVIMQVERAADARNFSPVGNSIAATQIRCNQPFDFTDAQPLPGHNYYRLKMIDVDGQITYSPVILINSKNSSVEIVGLYPSIVKDETRLSIASDKATVIETIITDIAGRTVQSKRHSVPAGSSLVSFDCSRLATGMYQVISMDAAGNITTKRFIKE